MKETPFLIPYFREILFEKETDVEKTTKLLNWFKSEIDFTIKQFLLKEEKEHKEISDEATDLVVEISRFIFSGGHRVRPAFVYSGYVAAGGRSHDAIIYASMCVEFLHTFALIHDDIIDKSDSRRGKPTSHVVFEGFHKSKKLSGDKKQYGLSAAILAGDLAATMAENVLTSAPFPQERLRRARYVFDQMKAQVITGQYLDVLGGYRRRLSEEEILKILEYKTAKYTVERPLQIGATLAGAEVEILEAFTAYGIPLGQAFQLEDDILGIFGDSKKIGKPTDSDIKEGKKTILIAKAYEWSDNKQRKILDRIVGNQEATNKDIKKVREIIYSVGAYDYAVKLSHKLVEQAKEALDRANLEDRGKEYLLAAADYLMHRV